MATQGLEVEIRGDVAQAVKALDQVDQEMSAASKAAQVAEAAFTKSFDAIEAGARTAAVPLATFTKALKDQAASSAALDAVVGRLDPLAAATRRLAEEQQILSAALASGALAQGEHARLSGILATQQAELAQRTQGAGKAFRLTATDLAILQSGAINTVQSLAAGLPVLTTLTTQAVQTAPALAGVVAGMGKLGVVLAGGVGVIALLGGAAYAMGLFDDGAEDAKVSADRLASSLDTLARVQDRLAGATDSSTAALRRQRNLAVAEIRAAIVKAEADAQRVQAEYERSRNPGFGPEALIQNLTADLLGRGADDVAAANAEVLKLRQQLNALSDPDATRNIGGTALEQLGESTAETARRLVDSLGGLAGAERDYAKTIADANRAREAGDLVGDAYNAVLADAKDKLDRARKAEEQHGKAISTTGQARRQALGSLKEQGDALRALLLRLDPVAAAENELQTAAKLLNTTYVDQDGVVRRLLPATADQEAIMAKLARTLSLTKDQAQQLAEAYKKLPKALADVEKAAPRGANQKPPPLFPEDDPEKASRYAKSLRAGGFDGSGFERSAASLERYSDALREATRDMAQAITTGGSLGDVALLLSQRFLDLTLQTQVLDPLLEGLFSGAGGSGVKTNGGGGIFGSLLSAVAGAFGGGGAAVGSGSKIASAIPHAARLGYATGGNPPVGVPRLVGEQGPEIEVPRMPTTIIDAWTTRDLLRGGQAAGGRAITVNQTIQVQGSMNEDTLRRTKTQMASAARRALAGV